MNLQETIRRILREEKELPKEKGGRKINLIKKMIYTLYNNVSFIEQSTFNDKPLLTIYFDSDDTAANIESWFDEKISRDIDELTSGAIVVCPAWVFGWDNRKKNADVFVDTELLKYDNLGNVINESLESKWNKGKYNYQHGYCHYFAYNIIDKIKKRFPNKKVNYYLLLANEVDIESGDIEQEYLLHVYIQIDDMLLDSNGITTYESAWERAEEWERIQGPMTPDEYEINVWDEESDTIPEMFFNSYFCNTERVKKDIEDFLSNPIVQRILRDK